MVKFLFVFLLLLQICNGCNPIPEGGDDSNPVTLLITTEDYLKSISFTGDVLTVETRFVSYSKKAGRVSVIDPIQEKEIWSKDAAGYRFAIALPDFSGVVLFSDDRITVMTQTAEKDFTLNAPYAHVSVAANAAAYGLASLDGTSVEVIRSLGAGLWQHETLAIPWGAIDSSITQPPENEPVLLVSSFNDDGTKLMLFGPADGRHAVFTANSTLSPLTATDTWCPGNGSGTPDAATFSSLLWNRMLQVFFAGTANGQIIAFDPAAACTPIDSLPTIDLGEAIPVNHLSLYPSGLIGVVQDFLDKEGDIKYVSFDGTGFTLETSAYNAICEVPLGSMEIGDHYIVVMCTQETVVQNPSDTSPTPTQTNIDPRLYITIDTTTGDIINRVNIDSVASAGVVVDPSTQTLYRMQEGAFGNLEIINLVTGDSRLKKALFLEGFLN